MRNFLFILILFCTMSTFANNNLARINDPDGYTNVHSGKGNSFPVNATIYKDKFFYCEMTDSEWIKIIVLRWQEKRQIEGYIHKSRVQLIDTLDLKSQQELLKQILTKQKKLADSFQKACRNKDSLKYITTRKELETYHENKYAPILDILPKYFCETKDTMVLQLFFAVMWADNGSADESPSFAIGSCFICQTDIVARQIKMIKNKKQRQSIYDEIEFGLLNQYDVNENGKSNNKEYNRLKKRLDNEKKSQPITAPCFKRGLATK